MAIFKGLFFAVLAIVALIVVIPSALANTVTFYNYGPENVYVRFTPGCMNNSAGVKTFCFTSYDDLFVPANTPNNGGNGVVQALNPSGWSGNWYTYAEGDNFLPVGVLCKFFHSSLILILPRLSLTDVDI